MKLATKALATVLCAAALVVTGATLVNAADETRVWGAKSCASGGVALQTRVNAWTYVVVYQSSGGNYANVYDAPDSVWRTRYFYSGIGSSTGQSAYTENQFLSPSGPFCDV